MALYASGVKIDPTLSGALSGVGTGGYNAINSNYDAARKKMQQEGAVLGRPAGSNSYGSERLGATQGLDVGNLESSLGAGVGNTAYQDTLAQRDYGQNRQLAEEIGRLNKPDLLSQILSGIGNVGGTAAGAYGAFGKNRTPQNAGVVSGNSQPSYGISDPYQYGYGHPSIPDFGYGQTYPNMMRVGG